jgi:hypothetical protein
MYQTSRKDRLLRYGTPTEITIDSDCHGDEVRKWLRDRKQDLPGVYMISDSRYWGGYRARLRFSHAVAAMAFKLRWG